MRYKSKNGNFHKYYFNGLELVWESPFRIETFNVEPKEKERATTMRKRMKLFNWYRNYKRGDCPI